jgi:hypothetical protein
MDELKKLVAGLIVTAALFGAGGYAAENIMEKYAPDSALVGLSAEPFKPMKHGAKMKGKKILSIGKGEPVFVYFKSHEKISFGEGTLYVNDRAIKKYDNLGFDESKPRINDFQPESEGIRIETSDIDIGRNEIIWESRGYEEKDGQEVEEKESHRSIATMILE